MTTVVIDHGGLMSVVARSGGTRRGGRRGILPVTLALFVAGCGAPAGSATPSVGATSSAAVATPLATPAVPASDGAGASAEAGLTFVMFGDSWPYGAHCNGCQPFPSLLDVAYAAITGLPIDFQNDTTNGGTAQELAATMRSDPAIQAHIEAADIIVIAIGGNDLEPAFASYAAGNCGGRDRLDCFRTVAATLRTAYDGMLAAIDGLRAGRPTAVRMVTTSNEFLSDQGLIAKFGADFGKTSGVTITQMNRDVECEVAVRHRAVCVDLGAALNGPDLTTPNDVNTQATMQQVADAIAASGLGELGL